MKNAIMTRKSVRTFTGETLSETHKNQLKEYISNPENLIGVNGKVIKIYYVETEGNKSEKIGTYGIIKNAPAYLMTVCDNTTESMVDCGYVFEKLIIFLETLDVKTCWLGGTFNRKKLDLNTELSENEIIPIISPIGYQAKKLSFTESTMRKLAKSDLRNDFDEMFFEHEAGCLIENDEMKKNLEHVRRAPSASNKQPWRVIMDNDIAHFYLERTPNYAGEKLGYDIQMIDIGIAISHYALINESVEYLSKKPDINTPKEYEYVKSVRAV